MPRQLPWKTGCGGTRTQTLKPSISTQKTGKIPYDIEDDFPDYEALSSDIKRKGKAKATSESDDALPDPSTSRTKRSETSLWEPRAASSSPPPLAENELPNEAMRKGVSKFVLRDDEWMMVEDEFLETAKLFTRHLHIAEYDRLKEAIEAKKREAEITRPVVAGAKRSSEGVMREKTKVQESRQKEAIRDVFASLGDENEEEDTSHRVRVHKPLSTTKPRPLTAVSQDTDSDDLDAPRAPKPKRPTPISTTTTSVAFKPHRPRPSIFKPSSSSFVKPTLPASPATARSRSRAPRMTPFEMLDEYTLTSATAKAPPPIGPYSDITRSKTTPTHSSPQLSQPVKHAEPRRSIDLLDDWGSARNVHGVSKEAAERIAKRKAERVKEGEAKGKTQATRIDDIPTFLI